MTRLCCSPLRRYPLLAAFLLPLLFSPQTLHADPVAPGTYGEVMSWYLRQAEDGKAEVAYFLGLQYERGIRRGGAEQAYRWFEEAARRGHPQAAFRIAADLWPGAGDATPEDAARARELFAVASGGGLAQAAYNLAVMAERGAGGEVDLEIAEAAYRKAARGGIAPAFLRLAAVAQASGTAEDADILAWLMLGAANGDITAAEFLNQASSQTDAATLEKARLKATAW